MDEASSPLFGSWLLETRKLQAEGFGKDPYDLSLTERADFVTWNFAALVIEFGEMMAEYPGHKNWVTDRSVLNREEFIGEAVDALHFLGNILAAMQCTDQEFSTAYAAKIQKNYDRMASGTYDGVSDKCPICKRELRDVLRSSEDSQRYVGICSEHGPVGSKSEGS